MTLYATEIMSAVAASAHSAWFPLNIHVTPPSWGWVVQKSGATDTSNFTIQGTIDNVFDPSIAAFPFAVSSHTVAGTGVTALVGSSDRALTAVRILVTTTTATTGASHNITFSILQTGM